MQVLNATAGSTKANSHTINTYIFEAPPLCAFQAWEADKTGHYYDRIVILNNSNSAMGNTPISNSIPISESLGFIINYI